MTFLDFFWIFPCGTRKKGEITNEANPRAAAPCLCLWERRPSSQTGAERGVPRRNFPLSHGRCRASSPGRRAKACFPNSPDVPEKGNAPLPGGRGRPPLRKVRPFVLLFKEMKFIPKGYHNCQLSIVNCQFSESILSLTNAASSKNPGILLGYPVKHYSLPPWTYLRSQSRSKSLLPFSMLQPVYRS